MGVHNRRRTGRCATLACSIRTFVYMLSHEAVAPTKPVPGVSRADDSFSNQPSARISANELKKQNWGFSNFCTAFRYARRSNPWSATRREAALDAPINLLYGSRSESDLNPLRTT